MECYDQRWCPDGECDLCDFWMKVGVSPRRARWLRVRRFFVRLWRRDPSAGRVVMTRPSDFARCAPARPQDDQEGGR